eukprot:scaffold13933_cov219-Amphora_coffeaeformis.AAC.4
MASQRQVVNLFLLVGSWHVANGWMVPVTTPSVSSARPCTASPQQVETIVTVDESGARSMFGTKEYWDDVYAGRGDFPADEYSWYFGWEVLNKHVKEYLPNKTQRILVPGVGNDPLLVDLVQAGYRNLVGQDYSEHAVERQEDLLHNVDGADDVTMLQGDVTNLPVDWTGTFDAVIEKGLLDAVYLSGDGNVEKAAAELFRVLKPGGVLLSVSGVVPENLRRDLAADAEWLRDGTNDLQAGCFVWRKKPQSS